MNSKQVPSEEEILTAVEAGDISVFRRPVADPDPLTELLKIADKTGGANATLGYEEVSPEDLRRIEVARQAAMVAVNSKLPEAQ